MSSYSLVSAVVLNYRRSELTSRCVNSVIDQVRSVVVVDNSGDVGESLNLNHELNKISIGNREVNVDILRSECNLGFAKGVQEGVDYVSDKSSSNAVLLINNDAMASSGMVDKLSKELAVCPINSLVSPCSSARSSPSMLWYHRFFALVLVRPCPGAFPYLSGACLLAPVSLVRPFLFDTDFFMYGEDVELSWRVAKSGGRLVVVDGASYEHAGSLSSRVGSLFYEYHVARGHILLARKLAANRIDWLWLLFGRSISLPLRACVRCMRHKSFVPWVALVRACLNKPPPAPD